MKGTRTNMPLQAENSPETLNFAGFNPEDYEKAFRNAPNIRLTDDMITCPLLGYAIENSLRAATSRRSLMGCLSKEGKKDFEEFYRDALSHALFTSFMGIKTNLVKSDYRSWHESLCQELMDICKDLDCKKERSGWTYGNSQKVVNLIVKYLVIIAKAAEKIGVANKATEIGSAFLAIQADLDIPIDSYIIEASWNYNQREGSELLALPFKTKKHVGRFAYYKVKAWSSWNKDDYDKYSESLHNALKRLGCLPLDWEGYAWIETRKARGERSSEE